MGSTMPYTNRIWRGFGQMGKTAKPKSHHLPKSTAGDFATTATDSAQSLIKSHLAEIRLMALFLRVRFSA
jgi:hypothetical protein